MEPGQDADDAGSGREPTPGFIGVSRARRRCSVAPAWAFSTASSRSSASPGRRGPSASRRLPRRPAAPACRAAAVALDRDRHQALLDERAVLGARRQLLADIAALLPIDAVQLVEARLRAGSPSRRRDRGCRRARRARAAAGRSRRRSAAREARRRERASAALRAAAAAARRAPRGADRHRRCRRAKGRAAPGSSGRPSAPRRAGAERGGDDEAVARVAQRHLGAQPVERQPAAQIVEPRRLGRRDSRASPCATMKKSWRYLPCGVSSAA